MWTRRALAALAAVVLLSGSIVVPTIEDGAVTWGKLSTAVQDSIQAGGGGVSDLDDLGDVTITSPSSGDVLAYSGSAWTESTPAGTVGYSAQADTLLVQLFASLSNGNAGLTGLGTFYGPVLTFTDESGAYRYWSTQIPGTFEGRTTLRITFFAASSAATDGQHDMTCSVDGSATGTGRSYTDETVSFTPETSSYAFKKVTHTFSYTPAATDEILWLKIAEKPGDTGTGTTYIATSIKLEAY